MWGHLLNGFSLNWVRVDSNGDQLFFVGCLGISKWTHSLPLIPNGSLWVEPHLSAAGRSEQCPLEEKYLIQFMWPHQNALAWWNKWTLVAGRGNTLLLRYWYRTWILSAFSCGFITSLYKGYWVVCTRSLSIEKLCGFFVVVVVKAGQNGSNIQTCNLSTWKAKSGLARPLSG